MKMEEIETIKLVKLILDADASIKLSKISLIAELANAFEIILTKEVYEEQVVVGLKKDYPDASRVEALVKSERIRVKEVASIYDDSKLGKGEKSVIDYCLLIGADQVVSDDEAFLIKDMIKDEHLFYVKSRLEGL